MRACIRRTAQLLGMSLAVLLLCVPAFAQLNLGRISGSVTDESGGTMANAKVTVIDQDRGVSRPLTTDEAGAFAAPSLIPGNYTVRVEAAGFNTSERKNVLVQVGGDSRVDIVMKAGSQTQTVTVTEELPLVNTTAATNGGVMEGKEVTALPFVGRSYQSLLQFTPGVVTRPGGGSAGHSSNGLRSDANNWLFEGVFSGGVRTAGSIINTNSNVGDGASVVPPDAIQEFGISFQNKAEYGWKPGVASNVGIKSGTNSLHGTAFAVGQTDLLNARNPFNPPPNPIPALNYEQYGATAGGPIKKDKLFYFFAYEAMRFTQGTPTTHTVPTTALVGGDTTNSIPAAYLDMKTKLQLAAGAIDASGNVINSALLTPQQQLSYNLVKSGIFQSVASPTNNGVYNYGLTAQRTPSNNLLGKFDYHVNDKNSLMGEYFWNRDHEIGNSQSVLQPYWDTVFYLTGNVARGTWTYLPNTRWVNELHFGFDRKVENSWPAECQAGFNPAPPNFNMNSGAPTPCLGSANAAVFSLPGITINGFDPLGATSVQQRRVEGYWSIVDNASYTFGNHNMKFGFENRNPYFSGGAYASSSAGAHGAVSFGTATNLAAFSGATALESFLAGVPSTGSLLYGDPTVLVRDHIFGFFAQDDWRITRRLTLNLGLRYEYETALSEANNKLAQFDPTSATGLSQLGTPSLPQTWHPQGFGANMQPRFGMVWDVTGKGTTVVRGAIGIYSNWPVWQVPVNIALLGNNPTGGIFYSANGTPTQGPGSITSGTVTFATAAAVGANPPVPTLTWTATGPVFQTGGIKCGNGLGQVNPNAPTGPANPANPGTCSIGEMDQNWRLPYVEEWTLGIQHALTSTMSLDVAYVGNHGRDLMGALDANMPTIGTNSKIREQQSRPFYSQFPYMGQVLDIVSQAYSNYNALQATFTQRTWHGLSSTVAYTYSHTLDVTQADLTLVVNPSCALCDYGPTGFDTRHRMTVRATYAVPGRKGYAQMLQGWQLSSLVNLIGALPWAPADTSSDFSGTGEKNDRWTLIGTPTDFSSYGRFVSIPCWGITSSAFGKNGTGCTVVSTVASMPQACVTAATNEVVNPAVGTTGLDSLKSFGCYMSGNSVIVPPAQGTFGNMGRNIFRGAGLRLWDFSVRKKMTITERLGGEFQFDMYNVTNSPQFATPSGNNSSLIQPSLFGSAGATPNVSNGNVVGGTGDARRYQFGLKLTF